MSSYYRAGRGGDTHTMADRRARKAQHDHTSDGVRTGSTPKMTPEQVAEARRMLVAFKTKTEVARHFGVSRGTLNASLASVGSSTPSPAAGSDQ